MSSNRQTLQRDRQNDRIIRELMDRVDRLERSFANKARLIEQATQPALTLNAEFCLWRDTDDGKLYFISRADGTDKKIELL